MRKNYLTYLAAASLALGAGGVVLAAEHGAPGDHETHMRHMNEHHGPMRFSVEHVAMHNIMAELLAAKTGRSVADIQAIFDKAEDPRDAFEQMGLTHDDVRPLFHQAHLQLIDKAAAAGMITSAQAKKLREAKMPEPGERGERGDRGERGERSERP